VDDLGSADTAGGDPRSKIIKTSFVCAVLPDERRVLRKRPITYWLAPGRRTILLTVFRKTRNAEVAEVVRALQALKACESEHGAAHDTSAERHPEMTADHTAYEQLAAQRRDGADCREGYAEASAPT
jgi:hypothetical protein